MNAMMKFFQPQIDIFNCEFISECIPWTFNNVSAPYWRYYYFSNPGAEIIFKGKSYYPSSNSLVIIPPSTCFSTRTSKPFAQFYIHFALGTPFCLAEQNIYVSTLDSAKIDRIHKIKDFLEIDNDFQKIAMDFFALIYDALSTIPADNFIDGKVNLDLRVVKAIEFLENNVHRLVSNDELAEEVHMSRNGFIRLFSSEVGKAPLQYGRKMRIDKACLLLHYSRQSIDEIAVNTGFNDRYYFSRVFKQVTNTSPAEYRKHLLPNRKL